MSLAQASSGSPQLVFAIAKGAHHERYYPNPATTLLPNIPWGRFDTPFTPAYWAVQAWIAELDGGRRTHRLGATLLEETVACLLGGFGFKAEIGLLAFKALKDNKALEPDSNASSIEAVLRQPFALGDRTVRYRFPNQKSKYIHAALQRFHRGQLPEESNHRGLRNWLLEVPGIGPKTASWIVRNWMDSDEVAVLDIHIIRAGVLIGLFRERDDVGAAYLDMEERYLTFSRAIGARASLLDALMWRQMRESPRLVADALRRRTELGRRQTRLRGKTSVF